ncbi:Olfactory receptor 4C15 [Sciurus carolinensis]|uniref:Olfactory receptor 4C15 n=1 Tax=Sciurus carolinensis TaxID=30640 RepID=A0AA41T2V0_SCICA|nr:Olfactory receptor 4C15 [Sciurus carolinensis]
MLILVTILCSPVLLGSPMYFFLAFLSLQDAGFSAAITPEMIVNSLYKQKNISYKGCMIQFLAGHSFGGAEMIILTVMTYDHYVAICKPLHYTSIMNWRLCGILIYMISFTSTISLEIMKNQSFTTEFVLLGLSQNPTVQKIVFGVFLLVYIATTVGNMLIVVTILCSPALLVSPMYYFLAVLSFLDACFSSAITPKMVVDSIRERKTISYEGCMIQLFAEHFFGGAEMIILTVMVYDHYVVICKPLHYSSIMNWRLYGILVGVSWTGVFLHSIIQILFTFHLPFCGPNVIDHFMCDLYPLLRLACTDTHILGLLVIANSGLICIINFPLLLVS